MQPASSLTGRLLIWSTKYAPGPLWRVIATLLGSDVTCKLPESTAIGHPYGIVIHSAASIGERVTIMQNVTIGAKRGSYQAPRIGDGVYIGAGAILLGDISVGADAVVGAGAVVLKDVPPGVTVVGNPARPIAAKTPSGKGSLPGACAASDHRTAEWVEEEVSGGAPKARQ